MIKKAVHFAIDAQETDDTINYLLLERIFNKSQYRVVRKIRETLDNLQY